MSQPFVNPFLAELANMNATSALQGKVDAAGNVKRDEEMKQETETPTKLELSPQQAPGWRQSQGRGDDQAGPGQGRGRDRGRGVHQSRGSGRRRGTGDSGLPQTWRNSFLDELEAQVTASAQQELAEI